MQLQGLADAGYGGGELLEAVGELEGELGLGTGEGELVGLGVVVGEVCSQEILLHAVLENLRLSQPHEQPSQGLFEQFHLLLIPLFLLLLVVAQHVQ